MDIRNQDAPRTMQAAEKAGPPTAVHEVKAGSGSGQDAPPPKDAPQAPRPDAGSPPLKRPPVWPWIAGAVVILGIIGGVLYLIYAPDARVTTDDAFVTAHYATIAPRIPGQIASVDVDDNQPVKTGALLATIDDRDYRSALATAEALLERDRAQLADALGEIGRQPSVVDQSQTQNPSAAARVALALANQRRYRGLAATGAGTVQERQQADEQVQQAQSAVDQAKAATDAAKRQLPILEARRAAADAAIKADQARMEQASLNLSYTRIVAPVDGMVGQRTVQVGNYVAPGAALMVVAPLEQIYIVANYREVALRHVLPGQHVRIHVDAYDLDLDGVVDSVPPASGATFGAISPNNATGNFTKIVQRLPVKILVSPGQNEARLLRLGFSVETTIDTELADVRGRQRGSTTAVTSR